MAPPSLMEAPIVSRFLKLTNPSLFSGLIPARRITKACADDIHLYHLSRQKGLGRHHPHKIDLERENLLSPSKSKELHKGICSLSSCDAPESFADARFLSERWTDPQLAAVAKQLH